MLQKDNGILCHLRICNEGSCCGVVYPASKGRKTKTIILPDDIVRELEKLLVKGCSVSVDDYEGG